MAYNSVRRPGTPYNYETPEQKARDVLRGQRTIARSTTNADQRVQSIAALQALAKATGVPASELPAGGIHSAMSPADVQAATDRINRWASTQQRSSGQSAPPNAAASSAIAGGLGLPASTVPGANAAPFGLSRTESTVTQRAAPQTRTTPTGGTETLVQSQSGPRWVASVSNAPAPNNQNGQISRDPGGRTQLVQPSGPLNSTKIVLTGNKATDAATLAERTRQDIANQTLVPVGTAPAATAARPWQPTPGDYAYATNGPRGQTAPIAGVSPGSAHNDMSSGGKPWQPAPPVVASVPPANPNPFAHGSQDIIPGLNLAIDQSAARIARADAATGAVAGAPSGGTVSPTPVTPPIASATPAAPIPGLPPNPSSPAPPNPVTSPSRTNGINQPFNPDEDDEERRKRLPLAQYLVPMAGTGGASTQPYQF